MTTSTAREALTTTFTPMQRDALIEIVERAEIRGKDAPLVVGILRALGNARDGSNDMEPRRTAVGGELGR